MAKDGSIIIDTAIETAGLEKGTRDLELACKRAAKSVGDIGDKAQISISKAVNAFVKQNQAFAAQKQKVEELQQEYDELSGKQVETADFSGVNKEINDLSEKIARLEQRKEDFLTKGGRTDTKTFKGMEIELERLQYYLQDAKASREDLLSSGAAYQPADTSGITAKLAVEQQKLAQMNAALQTSFSGLQVKLGEYGATITPLAPKTNVFARTIEAAKNGVASFAETVKAAAKSGVSFLGNMLQKGAKRLFGFGDSSQSVAKSFTKGLKSLVKYGLGMRTLYNLFNKLREAITAGLGNLAKFDGGTNKSLSSIKSSLTQVKNSLATAFTPILTVIAPILQKFSAMLSQAATYIGMFIARLTGASTFTKAIAVQENYADSLNGTAAAAKNAQKQFSGLDEITTWQNEQSGGGGGGGVSAGDMFETVEIESSVGSLADKLKEAVAADDWKGVGSLLAEKLNGAIANLDFAQAGAQFGKWITNALQVGVGFMSTFDWQQIGTKTAQFLGSIDWSGIIRNVLQIIGSAVGALAGFLWGFIKPAWNNVVQWWKNTAFKDGEFTIQGLLLGMWEAIKGVGTWIIDNIFTPIATGFKEAFGIESPSKEAFAWGEFIILGLFDGLTSLVDKVKSVFTNLKTNLFGIAGGLRDSLGTVWNNTRDNAVSIFQNTRSGLSDIFKKISGNAVDAFGNTRDKSISAFTAMANSIKNIFTSLKTAIRTPMNGIIGFVNGLVRGIVSGINGAIRALNRIRVNVPSWVPGIGGRYFGFNIAQISAPSIPYLATGAVIPPNAPFTAVLGDQKHGRNLEAPEDLIRQIVREESGGNGEYRFVAQLNRRTIFDEVITEAKLRQGRTGKNPFSLA